jgi:hypothetical protein
MKATASSASVFIVITVLLSATAFAGNGFTAMTTRPGSLWVLAVGIIIGAAAVAWWRRYRGN